MPAIPNGSEALLEVISPDSSQRVVRITESPFLIGRGGEAANHLQLRDPRISRQCAAIVADGSQYYLEDRGHRRGVFVNGEKIDSRVLRDGDVIDFGLEESYKVVFHSSSADSSIQKFLGRIDAEGSSAHGRGLQRLNLLLEATMLLHSRLPLESVLGAMLDHAIAVTDAERGLLLEADASASLRARLARSRGGLHVSPDNFAPSQTALRLALGRQASIITEDLNLAETDLQNAQSIVAQRLRAVVAIPLYATSRAGTADSAIDLKRGQFLGVLYLDSQRPAAFSKLDRQILDAIAIEAASILDNARLVERERQRQRLEQELSIAREIQQGLLPCGFRDFPHLTITGINSPCQAVGGDYFDVFPITDDRTAFLIADVCGKGLGAALLTTMLQGALSGMRIGADPARVFNHLNRFLCEHSELGRYATMFFGILDRSGHFSFINAGHPSPLLLRPDEIAEPFTDSGFPVGLIPEADYTISTVQLEPGDTLVLFSDGVTEAMDPREQMFGMPRLREVLAGHHDAPLDRLQKIVLESVESFCDGAEQADDITLLLARYRGAAQAAGR